MVSGDNIVTAKAVAIKSGIMHANGDSVVYTGKDFNDFIRDPDGTVSIFLKFMGFLYLCARSIFCTFCEYHALLNSWYVKCFPTSHYKCFSIEEFIAVGSSWL